MPLSQHLALEASALPTTRLLQRQTSGDDSLAHRRRGFNGDLPDIRTITYSDFGYGKPPCFYYLSRSLLLQHYLDLVIELLHVIVHNALGPVSIVGLDRFDQVEVFLNRRGQERQMGQR